MKDTCISDTCLLLCNVFLICNLKFYGPVNIVKVMLSRSVSLCTLSAVTLICDVSLSVTGDCTSWISGRRRMTTEMIPWSILDWLQSFLHFSCHSLSLPVAVFVSLILFHCFTTETSFPLRDITYQIIISCTRLYTFEKKRENDRKDRVWRQTRSISTRVIWPGLDYSLRSLDLQPDSLPTTLLSLVF